MVLHYRRGGYVGAGHATAPPAFTADNENDLRVPPANHSEFLHGDWEGYRSIRVNRQWRICFRFEAGKRTIFGSQTIARRTGYEYD